MTSSAFLIAAATILGAGAAMVARPDSPPSPASELVFTGMCDASAGLLVDANHLVVANDEDSVDTTLRVYDLRTPGAPAATIDATAALAPEGADAEVDLEGLTRFGSRFALIGSHSLKGDDGKPAPSRRRLIAFELTGAAPRFTLADPARYTKLVDDAQAFFATQPEPLKSAFRPRQAARREVRRPEHRGVERQRDAGRAPHRSRQYPLGPGNTAIVLPLKNAAAVLDAHATPAFGAPILLPLGKQGLRDLVSDGRGGYLLLAGEPGEGARSRCGPGPDRPARRRRGRCGTSRTRRIPRRRRSWSRPTRRRGFSSTRVSARRRPARNARATRCRRAASRSAPAASIFPAS